MPYIKSKDVRATPLCSLKYICNKDKTDDGLYVSGINCMSEPKNAYEEMKRVYEFYSGRKFDKPIPKDTKGKVKLIHYVQSFDPKDNVPTSTAHSIAKALVSEMFGDNVQAMIATHNDTDHVHNHILINVYDLDGKRFYSNQTSLKKLKAISDSVCLRHGIKLYDKTQKSKPKITAYNEWEHKKKGTSWKQHIRDEINSLIPVVQSLDELLLELENRGYIVKRGKYISLKAPNQEKAVRTKTLGDDYTEENIIKRIANIISEHDKKRDEFHSRYKNLCNDFNSRCGAYKNTKPAIQTHSFYYEQYSTIVSEHLNSIDMVREKLFAAQKSFADTNTAIENAVADCKEAENIINLSLHYFNNMNGIQKKFPRSEKDKSAVAIIKKYGLKSADDLTPFKNNLAEIKLQLTTLRGTLPNAKAIIQKYQDIVDTFDMMNSGEDYISRLVREAREKCTLDEWSNVVHKNRDDIYNEIAQGYINADGSIQRKLADKIMELHGHVPENNVDYSRLISNLATLRADNITSPSEYTAHFGQIKTSLLAAENETNELKKQVSTLKDDIHMVEIYVANKTYKLPNMEWFEKCHSVAKKYGIDDEAGVIRLNNRLSELETKVNESVDKHRFYYNKKRDFAAACENYNEATKSDYIEHVLDRELQRVKKEEEKQQRIAMKKFRGR